MAAESWTHGYAQANGLRIHYVAQGQGYPLILLHGWPQTWSCWRKVIGPLARRFRVIAPDLRGFGDTDKPEAGYGIRTLAGDVAGLAAALGVERATLVGHDLGGGIAFRAALDYPELVERLVIVNMGYPVARAQQVPDQARLLESWYVYFVLIPGLPERLVRHEVGAFLGYFLDRWTHRKDARTPEEVAELVRAFQQPGALRGGFSHYRARYSEDVAVWQAAAARTVPQPTLVLWGERDPVVPPQRSDGMHRYIPNIRFRFIPDAGHFPQEETPEVVVREVEAFLADRAG